MREIVSAAPDLVKQWDKDVKLCVCVKWAGKRKS